MSNTPASRVLLTQEHPLRDIGKYLICLQRGNSHPAIALSIAEEKCSRSPTVIRSLRADMQRAAVGAGTTTGSGWASELSPVDPPKQVYAQWEARSITGRVSALPTTKRAEFHLPYAKETGGTVAAAWRPESLPAIQAKGVFGTGRIDYTELAILTTATIEAFRFGSTPEIALAQMVIEALGATSDTQFLDPTVTATSAHPASITNGAQPISSSGSTASQVSGDLASMIELMQVQSNGDGWVWIMRPATYYSIAAKFAGAGTPITNGFLLGVPVILGAKSPKQVTLLDTSNIVFASDGAVTLETSTEASIEMNSSPSQSGSAGTGASLTSAFQAGLVGVLARLGIGWATLRYALGSPTVSQGCCYMSVSY